MRFQVLVMVLALPFIVAAMISDARYRRLPNTLTVALAALAIGLHGMIGGLEGLGNALLGMVVGFAVLLPLYLCHMLGAGDVKFLGALGAFLGFPWILHALAVSGALVALVYGLSLFGKNRQTLTARWAAIATKLSSFSLLVSDFASHRRLSAGHKSLPYGVYLGLAAIGTSLYRVWLVS